MPSFAILIDDGEYLASAPASTHADMDAAILSTIQTAATFATSGSAILDASRSLDCEVQDHASRARRRFTVVVEARNRDPDAD